MKKRDKEFYYTKDLMVKDLIKLIPFKKGDRVLDAGSGDNKVWYNNIPRECERYECEIERGCDFYKWEDKVDWVIGNLPFHIGWDFVSKSLNIAQKGMAFLGNINFFNQFTPRRLELMSKNKFYLNHIHILADKRWFGRYYFIIFEKKNSEFITWNTKTY